MRIQISDMQIITVNMFEKLTVNKLSKQLYINQVSEVHFNIEYCTYRIYFVPHSIYQQTSNKSQLKNNPVVVWNCPSIGRSNMWPSNGNIRLLCLKILGMIPLKTATSLAKWRAYLFLVIQPHWIYILRYGLPKPQSNVFVKGAVISELLLIMLVSWLLYWPLGLD